MSSFFASMARRVRTGDRRKLFSLFLVTLAFAACVEDNLVNNPSFDLWCGKSLCGWQTDYGRIERVGTWHSKDYGVSFRDNPTQISQLLSEDTEFVGCMRFDLIADADPRAQLSLVLDFNDDGKEEFEQRIPDVRWQSLQFVVRTPASYDSVRFILRKQGPGRAVIAQLRVVDEYGACEDSPPLRIAAGGSCSSDASCLSGLCADSVCSDCGGPVAGSVRDVNSTPVPSCGEGHACRVDAQCAAGTCTGGRCQACTTDGSCPALAPCDADNQCASGACTATLTFSSFPEPTRCLQCATDADCGGGVNSCVEGACVACLNDPLPKQCAECTADEQCGSGVCEFGRCGSCRGNEQCESGQVCRYTDAFDVSPRLCTAPPASPLPRGALCEQDAECADGLRCGAATGEPKRCGVSCESDPTVCDPETWCTRSGLTEINGLVYNPHALLPSFAQVEGRVATCTPVPFSGSLGARVCNEHAECDPGACCGGICMSVEQATASALVGGCNFSVQASE
jgi:hypothetical protein